MTTAPVLDAALLRALVRLEGEVRALRETVDAQGAVLRGLRADLLARDEDAPPPAAAAPLPAGGGAPAPDFPALFAGRRGGGH